MEFDLKQYFKRILRWWWLIALSTVIAAGISYYVSTQQPKIYQTTTTLMVGQVIQKANPTGNDFTTTERLAESYAQMAHRQPILQATVDSLELPMDWQDLKWRIYAAQVPGTQLIAVYVEDTSPERAVAIADEIAYQLILQSPTAPENEDRQARGDFVQGQLDDLESRIETAQNRIRGLEADLDAALSARQIRDIQTEIASLESLINSWQANYADLLNFLEGSNSPNYLTIIEPAQPSYTPIRPDVQTNVLLAAAVGFVLALGAAFLLEYIDDTIKSPDDLTHSTGLSSLGSVASIKGKAANERLVTAHGLFSPMSEAYRLIRTNVQFLAVDDAIKTIMVTSCNPKEGKSTTAANLGIIMAQAELKTIIVDADLRQPTMHKLFNLSNTIGLTNALHSNNFDLDNQIKETELENLKVITSGPLPPNPAEMLGSKRMEELLDTLKEQADVLIIDSPPVLAVTDSTILSSRVDGVLMVLHAKRTRRGAAKESITRLHRAGAKILGGVLNQVSGSYDAYVYAHSYGHNSPKSQQPTADDAQARGSRRLPILK